MIPRGPPVYSHMRHECYRVSWVGRQCIVTASGRSARCNVVSVSTLFTDKMLGGRAEFLRPLHPKRLNLQDSLPGRDRGCRLLQLQLDVGRHRDRGLMTLRLEARLSDCSNRDLAGLLRATMTALEAHLSASFTGADGNVGEVSSDSKVH